MSGAAGRPGRALTTLLLAVALAGVGPGRAEEAPPPAAAAPPAEAWRAEFADVCSRTQDAMLLTDDELRSLVSRCERLAPMVERLGEAERKVYRRRLQVCRDLYQFVLDARATGARR